jgi:hypothetical protein
MVKMSMREPSSPVNVWPRWEEATNPKVVSEPNDAARFRVLDCSLKYDRPNASGAELA